VFKKRGLRIFGHKREEVAENWRRLHNKELHILYTSSNIISVIKSRKMKWAGHVECTGEIRHAYKFWSEKAEGKRPLGRP
jgi:hypothetical protein